MTDRLKLSILMILFVIFCPFILNNEVKSQVISTFEDTSVEYVNNQLIISYNLTGKASNRYNIWLIIKDSNGNEINTKALSGDIGFNIGTGNSKVIIWDIGNDGLKLDDQISVKIFAELIPPVFNKTNMMLYSTLLPGLGQTKISGGKPYWLLGVLGYGCIGGAVWYNRQSAKSYDQYLYSHNREESNNYFNQSLKEDNISKALGYTALGIWVINLVWVALIPNKFETKTGLFESAKFTIFPPAKEIDHLQVGISIGF